LNYILRANHGVRVGVLVNDFGEINIDARLVSAVDGQTIDLSNGCVCCTMQGDLVTGVRKILARKDPPEHLIVESSGISDPLGVVAAFRTPVLRGATRLHAVVTVVDALHAREPRLDRQLVGDQIRAADLIALNKSDLVDRARLTALRAWLLDLAPRATIVETMNGDLPPEVLFDRSQPPRPETHHSHSTRHAFASEVYTSECALAYRRVREALETLPPDVFRAKGFLYLADAPLMRFLANRVGRRVTIDVLDRWEERPRTELVFLGPEEALRHARLERRLDACGTGAFPLLPQENFERFRRLIADHTRRTWDVPATAAALARPGD
jgi:G3E family GTPase